MYINKKKSAIIDKIDDLNCKRIVIKTLSLLNIVFTSFLKIIEIL